MAIHTFFLILLAMLLSARICGELAARLGAPPVIGELVAGVILGPSLLGWVEPNQVIRLLAEIGIILLLLVRSTICPSDGRSNATDRAVVYAYFFRHGRFVA